MLFILSSSLHPHLTPWQQGQPLPPSLDMRKRAEKTQGGFLLSCSHPVTVEISPGSLPSLLPACSQPSGPVKLIFDLARSVMICVSSAVRPHRALCIPAALITIPEPPQPETSDQLKMIYS